MSAANSCVFCSIINRSLNAAIVFDGNFFLAIMDKYPITNGHVLVIPKNHYDTLLDMNNDEVGKLYSLVRVISKSVVNSFNANGFNIGQNNGKCANQIVPHVHVHIIPRFNNDSPDGKWPTRTVANDNELIQHSDKIKKFLNHDLLSKF
ncbi:MAG: HIT family protein [Nitrososphaeraceae archaeon]